MKLEVRLIEDHEYYHDLESWYPSIFWELEFGHKGNISRSLSIHFGRLTFGMERPVLNPLKYSYNNYEEMQALKEKHDVHWWFGDVVDKWTGRDRVAEAEARYQELLGSDTSGLRGIGEYDAFVYPQESASKLDQFLSE